MIINANKRKLLTPFVIKTTWLSSQ